MRSVVSEHIMLLQESLEDMLKSFQTETKEVLHSLFPHINIETAQVSRISVFLWFHFSVLFLDSLVILACFGNANTCNISPSTTGVPNSTSPLYTLYVSLIWHAQLRGEFHLTVRAVQSGLKRAFCHLKGDSNPKQMSLYVVVRGCKEQ